MTWPDIELDLDMHVAGRLTTGRALTGLSGGVSALGNTLEADASMGFIELQKGNFEFPFALREEVKMWWVMRIRGTEFRGREEIGINSSPSHFGGGSSKSSRL
jgi:hypothetical protein